MSDRDQPKQPTEVARIQTRGPKWLREMVSESAGRVTAGNRLRFSGWRVAGVFPVWLMDPANPRPKH